MFDCRDLAFEEARLISVAEYKYNDFFFVADKSIKFLWSFSHRCQPEKWIFISFLSQIQKSLQLAFLSALRNHDIQTNMMLRYSLESISLALYSMEYYDEKYFAKRQEDGSALPTDALKQSFKWLEKTLPKDSSIMKRFKTSINSFSAHGNIIPTFYNTDFSREGYVNVNFFDKEYEDMVKMRLWWISDICMGFFQMVSIINQQFPTIVLMENFEEVKTQLQKDIFQIRSTIKDTETFSKYF